MAKFNAWWHYIQALGINMPKNVDTVVIPFFKFCYGRSGDTGSSSGQQSPVKKFATMSTQCLEAFCHLLNCPVERPSLAPLEVKECLLKTSDFVKHHSTIMNAVSEAMHHLDLKNKTSVAMFEKIFATVASLVHQIEDPLKDGQRQAVDSFLSCCHALVSMGGCIPQALPVLIGILDEVRKLPVPVLCAEAPTWSAGGQPALEMLKIILDPMLITICSLDDSVRASKLHKDLLSVTDRILQLACMSKKNSLLALDTLMTSLNSTTKSIESTKVVAHCVPIWKQAGNLLKAHIDKHAEVNQMDSTIEHNFGACEKILNYPLIHLSGETNKQVWKQHTELFRQVCEQVDSVVTAKPLEMQQKLCTTMRDALTSLDKDLTVTHVGHFSKVLCSAVIADISLTSPGDISESLKPIVDLLGELVSKFSVLAGQDATKECTHVGVSLCSGASALLSGAKASALVAVLMAHLLPRLTPLLEPKLMDSCGRQYDDATMLMFNNAVTLVQSRFAGQPTPDMLKTLEGFLCTCMSHPKRAIKTRSQQMWQVTFASVVKADDIPPEIASILKKSLILSSDSTVSSGSFDGDSQSVADPSKRDGSPVKMFGSFLQKTSSPSPATTPNRVKANEKPAATPSPLRNFRKPRSAAAKKASLEDESTQDFVPITNSGKKRRPLTDHQKEVMSSRRDDIPALYSELSRDDSNLAAAIPSQFMSQPSVEDDSSQVRHYTVNSLVYFLEVSNLPLQKT